ncbi:carbon-nitrogen hydrolase family protein [Dactylosporangium sp. CA-233914]|uniref:carbon-nitrogen hydrolase family protein n=1 Tax=Dactylosporangium sp. CA-233914 TaxID=3239934 RepID=UPI003D95039C
MLHAACQGGREQRSLIDVLHAACYFSTPLEQEGGSTEVHETDRTTRVAVAQLPSAKGDLDANLERAIDAIGRAGSAGHELLVFPECALSGYMVDSRAEAERQAIAVGDRRVAHLVEACRQASVIAVVGFLESAGDVLYNAAVTLGPDGILGIYRKQHLPLLGLDRFVAPGLGKDPRVVPTPIGNIGVMICFDLRFPESARVLALQGADIIAMPTAWPRSATFLAEHVTRVRALENLVYLAVADRADEENGVAFLGRSQVVSPAGEVLVDAGDAEGIFGAGVDLAQARTKKLVIIPDEYEVAVFAERKPDLYREITRTSVPGS